MASNSSSDANWVSSSVLIQNNAENKEVLIDDVDNKIYTIKAYIPKRITKSFLKPSYIIFSLLILILIIVIGVISYNKNGNPRYDLSNTSISLINSTDYLKSEHDAEHDDIVDEKKSQEAIYEETINTPADVTTHSAIIDTTKEENLLFTYEPDKTENETSNEIVLCEEKQIWSYDLNSQKLTLLYERDHAIRAIEISSNKTLFLSEENKIISLNNQENGTEINGNLIFEESRVNPKAMEMDFINGNLYIVDETMGGLIVINTQTKYYSLLLMDLKAPRSIALDPPKGILFIVTSELILKGNMDGTSLQPIINSTNTGTITLDKIAEMIYWVQDFENIMRSDYAGLDVKNILADWAPISELMILGNRLFWLRIIEGMNATLWSCSVYDNCNDHSSHYIEPLKNPKLMKGLGRSDGTLKYQKASLRRKCEHLSLAMPGGQVSCTCNMGSELVYNKTCHPYKEFGIYALNYIIRARFLDTSRASSVESIWPTPYTVESLVYKSSIDFDYDLKNDDFYFSDDRNIYQIKIKGKNSTQIIIMSSEDSRCLKYLVYDWFTGNIYYISREKGNNDYGYYIGVLNARSYIVKTNLTSYYCDIYNRPSGCIYGLTISPSRGYLFFTSSLNSEILRIHRYVHTMNTDEVVGIFDMNFYFNNEHLPSFAVDFIKNRLYYIVGSEINHINFDGTDRKTIYILIANNLQSVSVHKQWIYFNYGNSVWKFHKETRAVTKIIQIDDPKENIGSFKMISQSEDNTNPCRNNNGDCEQFCFITPKSLPKCDCQDNFTATPDGKCITT